MKYTVYWVIIWDFSYVFMMISFYFILFSAKEALDSLMYVFFPP